MKYCPSCQTEYADDTLQFCLQDGTRLLIVSSEPPTVAFGESETLVRPQSEKMRVEIPNSAANYPPNQVTSQSATPMAENRKSNTALTIFLTAFGMLLIFGLIGIGAWFYLKNNQTEIAKNSANPANSVNQTFDNDLNKNSAAKKSPTPKTPANSAVSNVFSNQETSEKPMKIDREQIETDVAESLENWKAQSEARNLNGYMNSYADTVDYYKKSGASRSFVRSDKQRAFTKFDSIEVNLSNFAITPDASGENATAVFDKEWQFSGAESSSSGKVRQQLSLRKIGGRWLITGEKDLKVYYIE